MSPSKPGLFLLFRSEIQWDTELSAYMETIVKKFSQPIAPSGMDLLKSLSIVFSILFNC